jgi:catechol 2,3-dioxygenase-like lactoylglutathione lyase family enzyme
LKTDAVPGTAPASTPPVLTLERTMQQTTTTSHTVHFGRLAPTLPVADMPRAVAFYTTVLGFRNVFENGSPTGFVILKKDAAELHLSLHKNHKASVQNLAHLMVDDAAALHDHLESHQVRIIKSLRDADFGLRCFVFADPDGNRIDVGQPL